MNREVWDLLDENREPLGRTHFRGDELEPRTFHTVISFDREHVLHST